MAKTIYMKITACVILLLITAFFYGCEEGIDDWNSSARVKGAVYTDPSHSTGLQGVQVIIEGDQDADNPYSGPDRWTESDANGNFEGAVFLGNNGTDNLGHSSYIWVGDLSVSYFWNNKTFSWNGGITVSPGSDFLLPPVDTTMFVPLGGGQ